MKNAIIKILSLLRNIKNGFLWSAQTHSLRNRSFYEKLPRIEEKSRYLILLPHVDDEWIGCSSLISNPNCEVILCNMDMLGGDSVDLHSKRERELFEISNFFKRSVVKYSGDLISIIKQIKPNTILLPFFIDWHEEHFKVMDILYNCLLHTDNCFEIEMYQVSVPIPEKYINEIEPLSHKDFKKKWKLFKKFYPSQIKIPFKRFAFNEKINGSIVGAFAGEAFVKCTTNYWMEVYSINRPNFNEQKIIKDKLNDLIKIREYLKDFDDRGKRDER